MKLIVPPGAALASTEAAQKSGFNALIYAPPKVGKTSLLFSLLDHPGVKGVLHLDFDVSRDSVPDSDRVVYVPIKPEAEGWDQAKAMLHWALTDSAAREEINTILVDGLSTAGDNLMDWILTKSGVKGKNGMLAMPDNFKHYGQSNTEMIGFVRYIRELSVSRGYHVVFTAHEKEFKDDRGKRKIQPVLKGQQKEIIPGIPDLVGRLVMASDGRRILSLDPEDGEGLGYRQKATEARVLPSRVEIKDLSNPKSKGETLATIAQKLGH